MLHDGYCDGVQSLKCRDCGHETGGQAISKAHAKLLADVEELTAASKRYHEIEDAALAAQYSSLDRETNYKKLGKKADWARDRARRAEEELVEAQSKIPNQ